MTTPSPADHQRNHYKWFMPITTRWMDNDIYGHINNVVHYAYFDTVANTFLIEHGGLDIHEGSAIGYIVHSQCTYLKALAFPDRIEGALRINRIGTSSVEYGIAIFKHGDESPASHGTFTHVFVERATQRPTPIPETMRQALQPLLIPQTDHEQGEPS